MFQDLTKATMKRILKLLRRLDWEQYEGLMVKLLLKVTKAKFSHIPHVAGLVCNEGAGPLAAHTFQATGIGQFNDIFAVKLVDELLDQIITGLERNDFKARQKQIMQIKLFGELYNYCHFEYPVTYKK